MVSGLHFVSAQGVNNFRAIENLINIMLHMAHHHDHIAAESGHNSNHWSIAMSFRRTISNILKDCITEIIERVERFDRKKGKSHGTSPSKMAVHQFAGGNNDAGIPNEEVTELLMKGILDDHQQSVFKIEVTRPRAMSVTSSANSFSFKADPLRSHTNNMQEAVKPANRNDLSDRLHSIVDTATEICLHMPTCALQRDFVVSIMALLMSQFESKLLPSQFCQKRLVALHIFVLHPKVPLQDRLYILKELHTHHANWSRLFLQMVHQENAEQAQIYRFFVFKLAKDYERRQQRQSSKRGNGSLESLSSGDLTSLIEAANPQGAKEFNNSEKENVAAAEPPEFVSKYVEQQIENCKSFARRIEVCMTRVFRKHEDRMNILTSKAIDVTGVSMKAQDAFRKSYLVGLRDQLAADVSSRDTLQQVIQGLVHERAIWSQDDYDEDDQQFTWDMDEVEGPSRMRIRMRKGRKKLDPCFYLEEGRRPSQEQRQQQPDTLQKKLPRFSYLLDSTKNGSSSSLAGIMVTQLSQRQSSVKLMEKCYLVVPLGEIVGEVLLSENYLYFVPQGQKATEKSSKYLPDSIESFKISLELDSVTEVWARWYGLKDIGLGKYN